MYYKLTLTREVAKDVGYRTCFIETKQDLTGLTVFSGTRVTKEGSPRETYSTRDGVEVVSTELVVVGRADIEKIEPFKLDKHYGWLVKA